jgi:cytidylate kinase
MEKTIITISREFGSGGRLIGKRLAEKLGVPYYDKELLDRIAEESGFSREMMEDAEKKAKNSFLYSLMSAMGTGESGPESLSLNERFFLAQFDTIRNIAEEGSCVIVGRCADYILRGMPEATHVFVYAEEEDKIKRAVEEYGVPEAEVKKIMKDTDKARANYYAYHTGRKWGEHVNYNLSIDSGYISIDGIVDLIIKYTESKLHK